MQANDDLAALFSRNLTLQSQPSQTTQGLPIQPEPEPEPIVYSISQHYTHSAHIIRQDDPAREQPSRPASEPPQSQQPPAELILNSHGVDHTALSPSQMELFKTAEDSQKLRLIELWRICPPSNAQENPALAWNNTTVEQEQMLAQLRYERKLAEEERQTVMSLDGTPLTPVQSENGEWVVPLANSYMEPYMLSGYEALARREYEDSAKQQFVDPISRPKDVFSHFGPAVVGPTYRPATDPVYDNDWVRQTMENQYGAFMAGDDMEL